MPQTIQCNQCGVILNLPPAVKPGKRMKCPRCGHRFNVTQTEANSASTIAGAADAAPMSAFEMQKKPSIPDDLPPALGDADLRETFDLPLVIGSARDAERGAADAGAATADVGGLFDRGAPRRRTTAAEARRMARRCTHCGGVVPQGMSICESCGTDQETGMRVGLADDLAPPPPPPPKGPPVHVSIAGGLCITGSLILLILAIIKSVQTESTIALLSWLGLGVVSAYGIFSAVQFVRGKSAKHLIVALTLGVVVDVMTLIALPLAEPFLQDQEKIVSTVVPKDADESPMVIRPFEERIKHDLPKIMVGIGLILVYAVFSLYLISPSVKKYIHSHGDRGP
jgi:phage FluMu protein Com